MTEKILFLDIDGPMLPARASFLPNQTTPYWKILDPVAVAMVNNVCETTGRRIVVHSSWVKHQENFENGLFAHLVEQGLKSQFFHSDPICQPISWRYDRAMEWLKRHPEIVDFVILDDEPPQTLDPQWLTSNLILVDYMNGLTWENMQAIKTESWICSHLQQASQQELSS